MHTFGIVKMQPGVLKSPYKTINYFFSISLIWKMQFLYNYQKVEYSYYSNNQQTLPV